MASPGITSLLLFVTVSTVTPGGATTLATASGANFGYRRSLPYIFGIALGLASMAAASAVGLGGLLLSFPALQLVMKAAGTAYLLWLALKIAGSGPPLSQSATSRPASLPGGVWMLWHNPKGWAMTLGAAASFASLAHGPVELGGVLGLAFGVAAVASLSLWCLAGMMMARLLRTARHWQVFNVGLALLLVGSVALIWTET